MGKCFSGFCALAVLLLPAAQADVIYSTFGAWNGSSIVGELSGGEGQGNGCDPCSTIAQTFIAPSGGLSLNSFTFRLTPGNPIFRLEFTGFVYAFSGDVKPPNTFTTTGGAVGSPLFLSPRIDYSSSEIGANPPFGTTVFHGASGTFTDVTVNVANAGGVKLVAGQSYVLGLTLTDPTGNNWTNSVNDAAIASVGVPPPGTPDGGGVGVMPLNGSSFTALTSNPWWSFAGGQELLGSLTGVPSGDFAYSADFGAAPNSLTISGTITPGVADLQYKELIYELWDGSSWYTGESLLNGTCAFGSTCIFNDTVYYAQPAGYGTFTKMRYSIVGFYGDNAPGNCLTGFACNVTFNPDVFVLTNGLYSTFNAGPFDCFNNFSAVWGSNGSPCAFQLEDSIASALFNGQTLGSQGLLPVGTNDFFFPATTVPNGAVSGAIWDFSNPVNNGSFNLTGTLGPLASPTPEPSTLALMGVLMAVLARKRFRVR